MTLGDSRFLPIKVAPPDFAGYPPLGTCPRIEKPSDSIGTLTACSKKLDHYTLAMRALCRLNALPSSAFGL